MANCLDHFFYVPGIYVKWISFEDGVDLVVFWNSSDKTFPLVDATKTFPVEFVAGSWAKPYMLL